MSDSAIARPARRPRFRRSDDAPLFQLTERDVEIVRHVARHRFLRSAHISQLLDAPHKKICERLTLLYHARYLDRPRSQLEYHVRSGGSVPYVYALGNQGARLLKECGGFDHANVDWARKNRDSTRQFLLHTLLISDFRVALAVACRARPELRLVEPDVLLRSAPEQIQRSQNPWSCLVCVHLKGHSTEISVIPDYVFALILPDGRRRPFVLECDRGTMPIERSSISQSSMLRKFVAYEAARQQGTYGLRYGWMNFRVLTTTSASRRTGTMRALIQRTPILRTSPLFLFADHESLGQSNVLSCPWLDGAGNVHSLV